MSTPNDPFKALPEGARKSARDWTEGQEVIAVFPDGPGNLAWFVVSKDGHGFYYLVYLFQLNHAVYEDNWVVSADVQRMSHDEVFRAIAKRMAY